MKRVFLFAITALLVNLVIAPAAMAQSGEPTEIQWITSFDELQAKMQQNPKKVYVDIYTNWCGWCKKMEASTFHNPSLVKYINRNFYAFRFDAERQDVIHFNGKEYRYDPNYKANALAVEWMQNKMTYPTSIVMGENFQNPNPIAGYLEVPQMETIVTYFGDNIYKHKTWNDYQAAYKPVWGGGAATNINPAAH